jgi:cell division protease FtsH
VPRGMGALGYTLQLPTEDRYVMSEEELLGQIDVLLGGRAAEDVVFGRISTGAASDLTRATDIARRRITDYGMSERFRHVALTRRGGMYLGSQAEAMMAREYSEDTQKYVDGEIARIVAARYDGVVVTLSSRRKLIETVATRLLDKETVEEAEFAAMVRGEILPQEAAPLPKAAESEIAAV